MVKKVSKIFNIVEDVSFESGGLRTAVVNLHNYINETSNNLSSVLITNHKEEQDAFSEFKPKDISVWNYSSELKKHLNSNINEARLLHLHGAWMHTQYTSSKIALKSNIPYIMTLHGMIEPWYLKQKQIKKKIYLELFLNKMLKNSNVIHAITPSEKANIFKLTGHKNIVEIPNFIHYSKINITNEYDPSEDFFLFLSRLHPGKGLDILIESMSKIENKKIKLKIVGTQNAYSDLLKKQIKSLGIENRIEFVGSVFGDEKFKLFANARAFIAPSYSEAIGMVNLEAAVCKTPVITSYNTGISPEWNNNGGIMIQPKTENLISAMNEAAKWSTSERIERGNSLRDFVIQNYSWENKGKMWEELYNSL